MSTPPLAPLRARLQASGLLARKALGQHFLLEPGVLARVAAVAEPLAGARLIEVGPGPGGLTQTLLERGASVLAIERDARFLPLLHALQEAYPARLHVHLADALDVDEPALLAQHGWDSAAIAANLPYNVGTPLLVKWLKAQGAWRGAMCLMFQKEVAQRIAARPREAHYGRLAVLAQSVTRVRLALTLPPGAFSPPPKVASAVVRLEPLAQPFPDLDALEQVTAAAFGQRRKMLRASLRPLGRAEALLEAADVAPTARAEELELAQFQTLARLWRAGAAASA
jgi:16S rRNA (adenine1518-N6/adenine1519-N6)-dimethyltransferase